MNLERIEEIVSDYDQTIANPDGSGMERLRFDFDMNALIEPDDLRELCRLARLGLKVDGAVEVTVPWSFTDIWYVTDIGGATPDQLAAATAVIVRVAAK